MLFLFIVNNIYFWYKPQYA